MERLKTLLSRILEIDKESINENTSPENVSTWDSFNGLLIASQLEDEFKVKFTMEEVQSVKNVGDIIETLKKYGVKLEDEK